MAIYFPFRLDGVADRVRYLDPLENTVGMMQVASRIDEFRRHVQTPIPKGFPH